MKPGIRIPDHWSPEQADLVLDFLDDISRAIWEQYEHQLCMLHCSPPWSESDVDVDDHALDDDSLDDGPPW